MLFARVVRVVYRHGDQTSREETGRGSDTKDDERNRGGSKSTLESVTRRQHAQHGVYRAAQWNDARASGDAFAQMPSCRLQGGSIGNRNVPDGCTYNFCFMHHELSKVHQRGYACTPAMAAGITDHLWNMQEVLTYKIVPAPWVQPKRPRRSRKKVGTEAMLPKRPRGRPRKYPLPDPTLPKRPRGRPRKFT